MRLRRARARRAQGLGQHIASAPARRSRRTSSPRSFCSVGKANRPFAVLLLAWPDDIANLVPGQCARGWRRRSQKTCVSRAKRNAGRSAKAKRTAAGLMKTAMSALRAAPSCGLRRRDIVGRAHGDPGAGLGPRQPRVRMRRLRVCAPAAGPGHHDAGAGQRAADQKQSRGDIGFWAGASPAILLHVAT